MAKMTIDDVITIMNTQNTYSDNRFTVLQILLNTLTREGTIFNGRDIIKIMSAKCFNSGERKALDICLDSCSNVVIDRDSFITIVNMFYIIKIDIVLKLLSKRSSDIDFKFVKQFLNRSCSDGPLLEIVKIFESEISQTDNVYGIFDLVKGSDVTDKTRVVLIDKFKSKIPSMLSVSAKKLSDYFSDYDQFVKACKSLNISSEEYTVCKGKIAAENRAIVLFDIMYDVDTFTLNEKHVFNTESNGKSYTYYITNKGGNKLELGYEISGSGWSGGSSGFILRKGLVVTDDCQYHNYK